MQEEITVKAISAHGVMVAEKKWYNFDKESGLSGSSFTKGQSYTVETVKGNTGGVFIKSVLGASSTPPSTLPAPVGKLAHPASPPIDKPTAEKTIGFQDDRDLKISRMGAYQNSDPSLGQALLQISPITSLADAEEFVKKLHALKTTAARLALEFYQKG